MSAGKGLRTSTALLIVRETVGSEVDLGRSEVMRLATLAQVLYGWGVSPAHLTRALKFAHANPEWPAEEIHDHADPEAGHTLPEDEDGTPVNRWEVTEGRSSGVAAGPVRDEHGLEWTPGQMPREAGL